MAVHLVLDNSNLAKTYDEISDSQYNAGRTLVKKLGVKAGDSVLDIGAGTGRLGRYVSELIGLEGSLIGIDPLEERIKIANEKNEFANAIYQIGSAEKLDSIEDSSIDVVYLSSVFHWVIDKKGSLREIFRVLKKGGKVGITTSAKELSSFSDIRKITDSVLKRDHYVNFVDIDKSTQNQHGLTTTELITLLAQAGFQITDVQVLHHERKHARAQDVVTFSEASSFGNYLNHVPEKLRNQAKKEIIAELEKLHDGNEITVDGYRTFAVATKHKII